MSSSQHESEPIVYQYAEAFCLMQYKCHHNHVEVIWNSRDGTVPFVVDCLACQAAGLDPAQMTHFDWNEDIVAPAHQPWPKQRVFKDGSPDDARAIVLGWLKAAQGKPWERPKSEWESFIAQTLADPNGEFQIGWPILTITA